MKKDKVKVYVYNYIYPYFNPPKDGLSPLSIAFENFMGKLHPGLKCTDFKFNYTNTTPITLEVDWVLGWMWNRASDRIRDWRLCLFNIELENLINSRS